MGNVSQGIFYFFVGELVAVLFAILVKNEKTRFQILIIGTILSGILAFSLQGRTSGTLTPSPFIATPIIPSSTPTHVEKDLLTEITDSQGTKMVLVPAGNFLMGSNNANNERPIHDVYLAAFYIDKFEVTSEMFVDFLNDVISEVSVESNDYVRYKGTVLQLCSTCDDGYYANFKRVIWDGSKFSVTPPFNNHPVTLVTWYGARNFANGVVRVSPLKLNGRKPPAVVIIVTILGGIQLIVLNRIILNPVLAIHRL